MNKSAIIKELKLAYISGAAEFDFKKRRTTAYDNRFRKYFRINGADILKRLKYSQTLVKVRCVTEQEGLLLWRQYEGWTGTVVRKELNSGEPASLVRISGDGVKFLETIINNKDLLIDETTVRTRPRKAAS